MNKKRLIIGITGASGIVYGMRLLQVLQDTPIETHLVISQSAQRTLGYELDVSLDELKALADTVYPVKDIGAAIASGSFPTLGMVIAPCSVRTMSEIACGTTTTLLTRAADVVLKERKKLILMVRESPLHLGHLRTMTALSEMGAIIAPPVPAFYNRPASIDDIVNHSVGRLLDLLDIDVDLVQRWGIDVG
ncbi:MAG: 4-hydroxy-3-polyprenylbenzoate decarboxylase [Paraglaciecola psychrophila]|jgi:4-hydroxy-3-polyprenylbenzoate decarboxylase